MTAATFSPAELDALLGDHDILANIDCAIRTLRVHGLMIRPDVIRHQAALYERTTEQAELLVALIGRRLSSQEGAL